MAQLIIDIPNDKVKRVIDAICTKYGYQAEIETPEGYVPNPMTRAEFAKQRVAYMLKLHISQIERELAVKQLLIDEVDIT